MPKLVAAGTGILAAVGCCCGGDWLESLGGGGGPPDGETRFVTASSLHLRDAPRADAASVAEMPRGAAVVVVSGGEAVPDRANGVAGEWVEVWHDGRRGYAFDGFLFPVLPPPEGCTALAQWAEGLSYSGPAAPLGSTTCQEAGILDGGVCDQTTRRPLAGGGFHQVNRGYEWGYDTLHFVGVRRDQVWAAARTCFPGPPDLRRQSLPTVPGEVPELAMPEGAVTAQVDGPKAGWEYPQGCFSYVYVTQVGEDVEITAGGGC